MCRPGPCAGSASCVAERGSLMGDVPGGRSLPPPTAKNPGILSPSPSFGWGAMGVSEARPSAPSCQARSRVVPAITQPRISPLCAAFLHRFLHMLSLLSTLSFGPPGLAIPCRTTRGSWATEWTWDHQGGGQPTVRTQSQMDRQHTQGQEVTDTDK